MSLSPTNIGDFLNLWHFFDDELVFGDGALGCGFKLQGKDISTATNEEINQFTRKLENLITSLDEGLSLQFLYKLTPHVSERIKEHEKLSKSCPIENYDKVLKSRLDSFNTKLENGHFFKPEIYLFLKGRPHLFKKKKLFEKQKDFLGLQKEDFRAHREAFARSRSQLESSLKDCGLFKARLSSKDWFSLMYEHFNLSRSETHLAPKLKGPKAFSPSSLLAQTLLSDIHLHKTHIEIGDYKFRVLALKSLPEETHAGLIHELLGLPFHCQISQVVKICDQSKEYNALQLKRRLTHSMASGKTNVSDMESESKLGQIEGLLAELIESSEKIVEADLNVLI